MKLFFYLIWFLTIFFRLLELRISKKNLKEKLKLSNTEIHEEKYFFLFVLLHTSFLIFIPVEIEFLSREFQNPFGYTFLALYLLCLFMRFSILSSLKANWNVKLVFDKDSSESVTTTGIYKYIRHPNYLVVILEIISIPMIYNAYFSMILFSILNAFLLSFRIKKEESILFQNPYYTKHFANKKRFIPFVF